MDFDNNRVVWVETSPTNKTITTNLSLSVYLTMDIFDAVMIPTVVVFGLIGNLLSIFVFGTTKLSHLPSSAYLTALAVSDGLSLLNLLLVSIPDRQSPIHVPVLCNLIVYSINVCGMTSSWLVVVFTVERFVVIQYPLHKLAKCSSRKARRLIFLVVPFPCLWYLYTFVIAGIDPASQRCTVLMQYHVESTVFHTIDILVVYLIPAIVVTLLNVKIARVLIQCQHRRTQMQSGSDNLNCGDGRPLPPPITTALMSTSTVATVSRKVTTKTRRTTNVATYSAVAIDDYTTSTTIGNNVAVTTTAGTTNVYGRSNDLAITRTLIATSTAFAVLNLPHNTIQMVRSIVPLFGELLVGDTLHVLSTLSNDLYYLNFAINVLVYHLTSSNYRKGAKRVLNRFLHLRCCLAFCRKRSITERSWRRQRNLGSKPPPTTRLTNKIVQKATVVASVTNSQQCNNNRSAVNNNQQQYGNNNRS